MSHGRREQPPRPLIRVCAYCDAVRTVWPDGTERWVRPNRGPGPEDNLSHGICPWCFDEVVAGLGAKLRRHGTMLRVETGRPTALEKGTAP